MIEKPCEEEKIAQSVAFNAPRLPETEEEGLPVRAGSAREQFLGRTEPSRRGVSPREIVIRVSGTGFLYNMVRIIAGTLMEVGRGAILPEQVQTILEACDRAKAGPTAPPEGLTLVRYQILPAASVQKQ